MRKMAVLLSVLLFAVNVFAQVAIWLHTTKNDSLHGTSTEVYLLKGKYLQGTGEGAGLIVTCTAGKQEAYLYTGARVQTTIDLASNVAVTTEMRLDGGKIHTMRLKQALNEDATGALLRVGHNDFDKILHARTAVFGVLPQGIQPRPFHKPSDASQIQMQFNMPSEQVEFCGKKD